MYQFILLDVTIKNSTLLLSVIMMDNENLDTIIEKFN